MAFDLSKIEFSNHDLRRNIKIPKKINFELAEFIGIMVGDGHIGFYSNKEGKNPYKHYEIEICGNIKDLSYYLYVNGLISKLFNIKFNLRKRIEMNAIVLRIDSKAIFYFLSKMVGLPTRKNTIGIPKCIIQTSKENKISFLRGLADADFTFTIKNKEGKPYPVVVGSSKSKKLIMGVCEILNDLQIQHCSTFEKTYYEKRNKEYEIYKVYVNGIRGVNAWFSTVSFSNKRHTSKYKKYIKRTRGDLNPRPIKRTLMKPQNPQLRRLSPYPG